MIAFDEPTSDYDDQQQGLQLGLLEYDDTHCPGCCPRKGKK